ncbi:hypothetical protein SARC_09882, partial [Sphaeroforma arctica JP610]
QLQPSIATATTRFDSTTSDDISDYEIHSEIEAASDDEPATAGLSYGKPPTADDLSDEDLATADLMSDEEPATANLMSDEEPATADLMSDEEPATAIVYLSTSVKNKAHPTESTLP